MPWLAPLAHLGKPTPVGKGGFLFGRGAGGREGAGLARMEFGEDGLITKGSQWLDTATLMDRMDEADMARSASETRNAVETAKSDAARVDSMDFGIG